MKVDWIWTAASEICIGEYPPRPAQQGWHKSKFLDNGCSISATGFRDDFVERTLVQIYHTHLMEGIVDSLEATQQGTLYYEVINDEGKFSVLEGTDIFMPDLKCRLLGPQDHFMDLQRLDNQEGFSTVTWEKSILKIYDQVTITINYEQTTHISILNDYKIIYSTSEYLEMSVCVISKNNQNLIHLENLLLLWNYKLGNNILSTVQCIGRKGCLGSMGENMGSNNVMITKFSACQYGNQDRKPKYATRQSKDIWIEGLLKTNQLESGKLFFMTSTNQGFRGECLEIEDPK